MNNKRVCNLAMMSLLLLVLFCLLGCGSSSTATKTSKNYVVSDTGNDRILIYDAPFSTGENASIVLGAPNLTTSNAATTQSGFNQPHRVTMDASGNLWVVDYRNSRILQFVPPFSSGMNASLVIGQQNYTTGTYTTTQSGLSYPGGAAFDSKGNLWVADMDNARVLEFVPPFSTGMNASLVIGQSGYLTSTTQTTQSGMRGPGQVLFDDSGNLWVADSQGRRVLEYTPPFSTGMNASLVIGGADFTTTNGTLGANSLIFPTGLAFDSKGNLWVADPSNARVTEYTTPFSNGMNATMVIGQQSFTTNAQADTQNGLGYATSVAFDGSGNMLVADETNHRIMVYNPPFSTGMNATMVLGQTSFTSNSSNTTASTLSFPMDAIAY
jgi:sugar lactone lactonase YvrE